MASGGVNYYREQVERCLDSDMSLDQWCKLNKISYSTILYWARYFCKNEPDVLGGYDIAHADDGKRYWFKAIKQARKKSKELAVLEKPGFVMLDTAELSKQKQPLECSQKQATANNVGAPSIEVALNGANITIPSGASATDISTVLGVVVAL